MTPREIIKCLLAREIPERAGLNEHFWPFLIENAWGGQGIAQGTDFVDRFNLDIRSVGWFGCPAPRPDLEAVLDEDDRKVVKRNGWGATFTYWKTKGGTPEHVGFALSSEEVWRREFRDAVVAIDVRTGVDVSALKQQYADAMASDKFVEYAGLMIFEEMRAILGDVVMLESLVLEPEWMDDFNSVFIEKHIAWYEFLFSEVGLPDGIHIYEDLGYTRGSFISPACHRARILPHHKRLFRLFKDHGLPIIVHTCGDFRPHIESLIEAGADCIQAMEAKTGMNVVEMAKTYKDRLCFMGNLDVRALESGDREKIREECLGKLNGMKALRAPYVFMSDHSIPPTVTVADYEYMLDLFWKNCRY